MPVHCASDIDLLMASVKCEKYHQHHFTPYKAVLHCGFQNLGTTFQIPSNAGLQIPRVNVDYRFESSKFRIPQAKISLIPESG